MLPSPSESSPSGANAKAAAYVKRPRRRGAAWTLPAPLSSFVGRSDELARLTRLLEGRARLVTIVGPGGIGKTRLAVETARSLARHGGLVAFCDLSEVRSGDVLVARVASALGFAGGAATTKSLDGHVGRSLARLGACVVVLDNFEQLA